MFKAIQKCGLLGLVLIVAGCGFQLRGTQEINSDLKQLALSGADREVLVSLRSMLRSSGIEIEEGSAYRLDILSYQQQRQVAAYNGASAAQYRVEGQLNWQLSTSDNIVVFGPEKLQAERLYSFTDNTVTSALGEEKMLKREMQRDLNQRLVRRIANIDSDQLALREREARANRVKAENAAAQAQQQEQQATPALLPTE